MGEYAAPVLAKVAQWLAHADEDLRWAQHGFAVVGGNPYRLIAYHAQQAVEKNLKAYLVLEGVDFPYTHNIARLLELCAERAQWAVELKDAEELTPYAIGARYPSEQDEVTESDARRAVDIAQRVRAVVRHALTGLGVQA